MGDANGALSLRIAQTGIVRFMEVRTTMLGYYSVLKAGATALAADHEHVLSAVFRAARLRQGSDFCAVRISETDSISPFEHELLWQAWESWTKQNGCISLPISGIFVAYFLEVQSKQLRPRYLHILELYRAATVTFYRSGTARSAQYFSSDKMGIWERMVMNELEPSLYHWTAIGEIFQRDRASSRAASSSGGNVNSGGIANGRGSLNGMGGNSNGGGESRRASTGQILPAAQAGNQPPTNQPLRQLVHPLPPRPRPPHNPPVDEFTSRPTVAKDSRPHQPIQLPARPPHTPQSPYDQNFVPPVGPPHHMDSQHFQPIGQQLLNPSAALQLPLQRPQQNVQLAPPVPNQPPPHLALIPPHFDNSKAQSLAEAEVSDAERRVVNDLQRAETDRLNAKATRQRDKELAAANRKSTKRVQDDSSFSSASAEFWRTIEAKTPAGKVVDRAAVTELAIEGGRPVGDGDAGEGGRLVRGQGANGDGAVRSATGDRALPPTRSEVATTAQSGVPERLTVGELTIRVMSGTAPTTNGHGAREPTSQGSKDDSASTAAKKDTTGRQSFSKQKDLPSANAVASTSKLPSVVSEGVQARPAVSPTALQFCSTPSSAAPPRLAFESEKVSPITLRPPQLTSISTALPATAPGPVLPPPSQIYSRDVYRQPSSVPNGPFSRQHSGGAPTGRSPPPASTVVASALAKSTNPILAPPQISTTLPLPTPAAQNVVAPAVAPVVIARKYQADGKEIDRTIPIAAPSTEMTAPVATKLTARQLIALASPRTSTITPWEERQTSPTQPRSQVLSKVPLAKLHERRPSTPSIPTTSAALLDKSPLPPPAVPIKSTLAKLPPVPPIPMKPPSTPLISSSQCPPSAPTARKDSTTDGLRSTSNGTNTPMPGTAVPTVMEAERSAAKVQSSVAAPAPSQSAAPPLQPTGLKSTPSQKTTQSATLPRRAIPFTASDTAPVSAREVPPQVTGSSALGNGLQPSITTESQSMSRSPSNLPKGKRIKAVDSRAASGSARTSSAVASTSTLPRATLNPAAQVFDAPSDAEAGSRTLGPLPKRDASVKPSAGQSPARAGSSATARGFVPRVSCPINLPTGRSSTPNSHLRPSSVDTLPSVVPKKKEATPSLVAKRIVVPPPGGSSMTQASLPSAVVHSRFGDTPKDCAGADAARKGKGKMVRRLSMSSDDSPPIKKRKATHRIPVAVDLSSTVSFDFAPPAPSPK